MIRILLIIFIFQGHEVIANFIPDLKLLKIVPQKLSLPYYITFNKKHNKFGQYTFWVSNNPFGSRRNRDGYISEFRYNPKSFDFKFINKICAKNILGITTNSRKNCVYPGIKSYPEITKNNKYVLEGFNCPQPLIVNSCISDCIKRQDQSYNALVGRIRNVALSPFTFRSHGIKYQLLAVAYHQAEGFTNPQTINNNNLIILQYALNNCKIKQKSQSINVNINVPVDLKFSPFACVDGTYLLFITNANSNDVALFKIDISNPDSISINQYQTINIKPNIGNYQQHYCSFSASRYLALNRLDLGVNNIYTYYFDLGCNMIELNNGNPYKAGSLSQVLTWSPDAKALIVPNYLDGTLTVFKTNTSNFQVKLKPSYTAQYLDQSSQLTAKVYNGTPPYTFYFSSGDIITQESNICQIIVSPDKSTVYNVTVVDGNGQITGIANTATIQIARPVISKIIPNCQRDSLTIIGKILDQKGFPVAFTTMQLFLNSDTHKKIYITSNKYGIFKYEYLCT